MNHKRKFYLTKDNPGYYFYVVEGKLICFEVRSKTGYLSAWTLEEIIKKYGAYEIKEEELALLL